MGDSIIFMNKEENDDFMGVIGSLERNMKIQNHNHS